MSYPNSIPAVREGLQSYSPPASIETAFLEAVSQPAPVQMIVGCFDVLRTAEDLDAEGRALLCGCAELINLGQWYGKATEALNVLMSVAPTLTKDTPS